MKIIRLITGGALALALFAGGCAVDQTKEAKAPDVDVQASSGQVPKYDVVKTQDGKMPSVDVDVKGGQLPKYDVETADVDVGTETKTVDVPKAKVVVEKETVKVPDIDVKMPDEKKK